MERHPLSEAFLRCPCVQAREAAKLAEKRRGALAALDSREVERDQLKYERVCWEKLR